MEFKQAYEALKQGAKIKRPHWRGFWMKDNDTITTHCKGGSVIPFLETEDIFVDLDNAKLGKILNFVKKKLFYNIL